MLLTTLATANNIFEKGVALYKENKIDSAISVWSSIEGESAALHYNLGNAWYQKGEIGKSILHYEKALKISPKDEEVLHNLSVAQNKRIDEIEELPEPIVSKVYRGFLQVFSSNGWLYAGTTLLIGSLLVFTLFLYSARNKKRYFVIFAVLGILGMSLFVISFVSYYSVDKKEFAVVIVSNVYIKNGPSEKEKDAFILHEGTKLEIQKAEENWLRIKLTDGKIGWIKEDAVSKI